MTVSLITFAIATVGIVYISRISLLQPSSYGFYRFFAWESILGMILLSVERWFDDPFSLHQMISWPLLAISAILVVHGAYQLLVQGKPDSKRQDNRLMGVEKTTILVTRGAYKYIRHPIYSSLLFLAWGVFFKNPSWTTGTLVTMTTIFLTATAKVEEVENINFFGSSYIAYMKQTKMFIPFIF